MVHSLEVEKTAYSVVDFLEWQRQGSLNLSPEYQRRAVWNTRVKSLLIDSLLRGFPIPLVFLHREIDTKSARPIRNVVDGQQRIRTILSFIDPSCIEGDDKWDDFTVLRSHNKELGGMKFPDLPQASQDLLLQTRISVNVLPADIDDVTVLEIFQRMNSTGFKLNAQESRNAKWSGEFKESSYRLAYEQYARWLGWGIFKEQDVRLMKEVELTSDLIGVLLRGAAQRNKATIDRLYAEHDDEFPSRELTEQEFREAFDVLQAAYAPAPRGTAQRRMRTQAWLYAAFAAVVGVDPSSGLRTSSVHLSADDARTMVRSAEERLRSGVTDPDLQKTLRGATADRKSRLTRIRFLLEA